MCGAPQGSPGKSNRILICKDRVLLCRLLIYTSCASSSLEGCRGVGAPHEGAQVPRSLPLGKPARLGQASPTPASTPDRLCASVSPSAVPSLILWTETRQAPWDPHPRRPLAEGGACEGLSAPWVLCRFPGRPHPEMVKSISLKRPCSEGGRDVGTSSRVMPSTPCGALSSGPRRP